MRFTDEQKYFVSEASVYRLLKAHDLITSPAYVVIKAANEFKDKTTAINQLSLQTDFTYLKITGWGWYYLLNRARRLLRATSWPGSCVPPPCAPMTLLRRLGTWRSPCRRALITSPSCTGHGFSQDNGSSYVAGDLARWLQDKGMEHVRGAPYHPQTQGKIERWHQTLDRIAFYSTTTTCLVISNGRLTPSSEHYNHVRYHESINNLTPADVYLGRAGTILAERQRIKRATIANRRLQHQLCRPPKL